MIIDGKYCGRLLSDSIILVGIDLMFCCVTMYLYKIAVYNKSLYRAYGGIGLREIKLGNYKLMSVDYSIALGLYVGEMKCSRCGAVYKFESKNIKWLDDYICKMCIDIKGIGSDDISKVSDASEGRNAKRKISVKYIKDSSSIKNEESSNVSYRGGIVNDLKTNVDNGIGYSKDRYVKGRVRRLWTRLKKDNSICLEWGSSYSRFNNWSLDNGYMTWKNLYRYNEDEVYSAENCYWGDEFISSKSREDSSDTVKIKELVSEVNKTIVSGSRALELMVELYEYGNINNVEYLLDSIEDIGAVIKIVKRVKSSIGNVDIK